MENKSHALAAGVFVLAVLALLVALAAWLTREVSATVSYELVTQQTITGLQEEAPVRYKGVTVGKVASITLDASHPGLVLMRLAVAPATPVTRATYATLGFQGVTGLSFIQLDDDGKAAGPLAQPLPPEADGGPPRIPFRAGLLGQLSDQAQTLVTQLNVTADRLNQLLAGSDRATLAATLADVGQAAKSVGSMAAALQANAGLLTAQTSATLKTLDAAAARADQALAKLDGAAGGALERIGQGVDAATAITLPRVNHAAQQLDRATAALSENPQALLYGHGPIPPGPGEPGYTEPAHTAPYQRVLP